MAEVGRKVDEDNHELNSLEKEISDLRSHKATLFQELERIAQRERECIEKHDKEKQQQTIERLIEVESELKHVKSENVRLSDTISKLNQTLDEATKYSTAQKLRIAELESTVTVTERELRLANTAVQARSEDDTGTVNELRKQLHETHTLLSKTTNELSGTRQRLSEVQERLTIAEQVTAATQQRALQESGNSDELQLEPTTHAGDDLTTQ